MPRVARFEASRRTRIPSPPVEPPVLVLWLNQVTRPLRSFSTYSDPVSARRASNLGFVAQPSNPDSFVVDRCKPCRLGAASTTIPLMTGPPRRPGSVLVLWPNQQTVVLGFVEQPRNPACKLRPHHAKHRARQAFHLRLPDGILSLAPFNDLATILHRLLSTTSSCFSFHHAAHTLSYSTTGSIEPSLLVSPLLGGPARLRPFVPTLHLHQHKSSRNLHLQYSAKSQSTPRCQSLITPRSDHPPVLGRFGPQPVRLVSKTGQTGFARQQTNNIGKSLLRVLAQTKLGVGLPEVFPRVSMKSLHTKQAHQGRSKRKHND
jgi:hypothetical protein